MDVNGLGRQTNDKGECGPKVVGQHRGRLATMHPFVACSTLQDSRAICASCEAVIAVVTF